MSVPFDEAQRCPKCKEPGEVTKETPLRGKKKEVTIYCRTRRCKWFNTPWVVTLNEDGTVPDPQDHTGKEKVYVGFEDHDRMAAMIEEGLKADAEASLKGGEFKYKGR